MTEKQHQKKIVSHVRKEYPGLKFSINPFSGMTFKMPENLKRKLLKDAKEQGWEKSAPDMIFNASRCGYTGLAIELKKEDRYPFRPWRRSKDYFIDKTDNEKYKTHILEQASYLHDLRKEGYLAVFCENSSHAIGLIDRYMAGDFDSIVHKLDLYEFYFDPYVPQQKFIHCLGKW